MIGAIKKMVGITLQCSGILSLYCLCTGNDRKLTILMYHRVVDDEQELDRNVVSASRKNFERQMRYLSRSCTVISFDEYLRCLEQGKELKKNSVIITFDDGYRDNYSNAFSILKKYKLPAMISLTAGHIGKGELFWWDKIAYLLNHTNAAKIHIPGLGKLSMKNKQKAIRKLQQFLKGIPNERKISIIKKLESALKLKIPKREGLFISWNHAREMSGHNVDFGAHTLTHPILTKMEPAQAKREILGSKAMIEKEIGKKVTVFTYPNGRKEDMSKELNDFMRENGFSHALSTIYGTNRPRKNTFVLRRVAIEQDDNLLFFRIKVCGLGAFLAPLYSVFFEQ